MFIYIPAAGSNRWFGNKKNEVAHMKIANYICFMKERSITMDDEMVRAIIDGNKTQDRRRWKPGSIVCPLGKQGDRLWVKESFNIYPTHYDHYCGGWESDGPYEGDIPKEKPSWNHCLDYRATADDPSVEKWIRSTQMPRWASRIMLELEDVRLERLFDISEEDAIAEGVKGWDELVGQGDDRQDYWLNYMVPERDRKKYGHVDFPSDPVSSFKSLWQKRYGNDGWDENCGVWVLKFKLI